MDYPKAPLDSFGRTEGRIRVRVRVRVWVSGVRSMGSVRAWLHV